MFLNKGDKLLVVHRRLFETDEPRFFIGEVDLFDGSNAAALAAVRGYTWFHSPLSQTFIRKNDERTKIISISSGGLMIYLLPREVDPSSAQFEFSDDGTLWLKATPDFELDLSESHFRRTERKAA